MRVVRELDLRTWRDAVDRNPTGNIFHTPEMFRVFERAKGYQPTLWAVTGEGREVLALLVPVLVDLGSGWTRPFAARRIAYGSVMVAPGEAGQEALDLLLSAYRTQAKGSALFTELRNLADLHAAQPVLQRQGFAYEEHLNYLIDLNRPEDQVWADITGRTRNYIRRGLRNGELGFREVTHREQIAVCYQLLRQTYRNAQVPLADRSLFESLFDLLCPQGMARFTLAYHQEVPVAVSLDLLYKGVIYYWYGGMDRAYSSLHPNEPLRWHILAWGMEQGYTTFDFGGAGIPDQEYSVRDFKAKFGGHLVCFGRNTCVHAPLRLRASTLGYGLLRRLL